MWRITAMACIGLSIASLTACRSTPEADDYFPITDGLRWEYQYQVSTTPEKSTQGIYRVSHVGTTTLNHQVMTIRRTNDGRDYYVAKTPEGVYRYASRTLFESQAVMDKPARMILPLPYLGSLNRQWSSRTTSYVIHRIGPSTIVSANPIKDFVMNYRISANNETVTVPAGTFKRCLLIEGESTLTLFADPLTGYQDISITTREWYAPGIGLVKLERNEPLNTRIYQGGSYLFELLKFKQQP